MSSTAKKLISASGGGGAGLNVEEVFSTFVYDGDGSTQTITNNIDLSGEGGLVWIKERGSNQHVLVDTERGAQNTLDSSEDDAQVSNNDTVQSFNSSGFELGDDNFVNKNNEEFCSWTFRKAPKFFDIVTWTGNGVHGRTISHNLNSVPGSIFIKQTTNNGDWRVYHKDSYSVSANQNDPQNYFLRLASNTDVSSSEDWMNHTAPTSTAFTVGNGSEQNASSNSYVAYLFAHNDGDGDFGPDADQDIIKCGYYNGNGSTDGPTVDLGFEPQYLLIKCISNASSNWYIFDNMRGLMASATSSGDMQDTRTHALFANAITQEDEDNFLGITSTGFKLNESVSSINGNNRKFIYIAIRRGLMGEPQSGTDVFDIGLASETGSTLPTYVSGFPVDMAMRRTRDSSNNMQIGARLMQSNFLETDTSDREASTYNSGTRFKFDYMNGFYNHDTGHTKNWAAMWRRAPGFFDVVPYVGTGSARTIAHNLGVAPEMMWVKSRSGGGNSYVWQCYLSSIFPKYAVLNETYINSNSSAYFNNTAPTATHFSIGTDNSVNRSNYLNVAYLFGSLAGISKLGTVVHSGSSTDVDCGFSSGARFVLLKGAVADTDWFVWDSVSGIVSGNDPYIRLNTNAVEVTNTDIIDPLSSGFTITDDLADNTWFFYAIA